LQPYILHFILYFSKNVEAAKEIKEILVFIINNKKFMLNFINKNSNDNFPSVISSTAIQFRKRIKPLYKSNYKAKKIREISPFVRFNYFIESCYIIIILVNYKESGKEILIITATRKINNSNK
jgi:hypothetical protein